ncbi:hypothetical protein M8A51_25630 [Schlegelella sp. S2-27]|uniref:MarR family transcriptional regulator n=1 Tax=Caldimonas mangrovi TaxID=2944811 RepID=A0ABT0YWD3_9BURK|nr:hypothetical protein [Caldimonas mangrovi]MCM5682918.1 hypothetical protein [Caldimonas mangrovi]
MAYPEIRAVIENGTELEADQIVEATGFQRRTVLEALRTMVRSGCVIKRLDAEKKDHHGRPVAYFTAADPEDFPRLGVEEIIASAMSNRHPLEQVWRV